ncbi:LysR substrate-binding domain-containing protein [Paraburkholderia acidipaludis]|uniref:LysR substrate-binding domain-containing protein n=1 Tax=Paraburkholderia acidipaludis TaxID=660537 RepID=UPI0005B9FCC1|nr:LysR substrate-binding domain-containing protein [Paraburkholderia acidipaludis]
MELRQLKYFAAIVEHGNMTRAAETLHVAQPALSQQLANLEADVGGRLFERGPLGMRATAAGEILYRHARSLLRQIDDMRASIDHEIANPSGRVVLGMAGSTARIVAAPLLIALKAYPDILIELVERPSAELVGLTAQGSVDLAIAVDAQPSRGVALTPLFHERLFVVLARGAKRSRGRRAGHAIDLAELATHPLLLPSPPSTIRSRIEVALTDAHLPYRLAAEVSATDLLIHLVASGVGVTALPWSALADEVRRNRIHACELLDAKLERELSLCMPADVAVSQAVEVVRDTLLGELGRLASSSDWRGVHPVAGSGIGR